MPLISVLLPVYNHERYVEAAVASVLAQTGVDLELIVIDDASVDGSRDILRGFDDPRLRFSWHDANLGAGATLNEAVARSRGDYLAILNSDDTFEPMRLEFCLIAIHEQGADIVGTDIGLVDADGGRFHSHWWLDSLAESKAVWNATGDWAATLLFANMFMTTSNFVMRRQAFDMAGPFSNLRYVHDYDFVMRAVRADLRLGWLDEVLLLYRLHGHNTIAEDPLAANLECVTLLRQHSPALITARGREQQLRSAQLMRQLGRIEGNIVHLSRTAEIHDPRAERLETEAQHRRRKLKHLRQEVVDLQLQAMLAETRLETARESVLHKVSALASNAADTVGRLLGRQNGSRPLRVSSILELREIVESDPHITCVSFDVFDTLLERCIEPPGAVQMRTAQLVAERIGTCTFQESMTARVEEEARLRRESTGNGRDHECHFDRIAEAWADRLDPAGASELTRFIVQTELDLEATAVRAKSGAAQLLSWLKAKGLRVIALSDMYLGREHVSRLLNHCGLLQWIDAVYVSADACFGKYSGRLYRHALSREDLEADAVLHIGDNLRSDGLAPLQQGMRGVHLYEPRERARRSSQQQSASSTARGPLWKGRHFFEIVADRVRYDRQVAAGGGKTHAGDFYFDYGVNVLGPPFALFTLGLVDQVRQTRPQAALFLARDGYLLRRLYDAWRESDPVGALPPSVYAYASRRVVTAAAVADGLTREQCRIAFLNPKQEGLTSLCRIFDLPFAEVLAIAMRHGFHADQPLAYDDPRLDSLLADASFQTLVRRCGHAARRKLEQYLTTTGFFDARRIALVDIGWNATMQRFLVDAFGGSADFPATDGFYFGYVGAIHKPINGRHSATGIMMDARRSRRGERAPADFEEIFEQAARAPAPTVIGYRDDANGGVVPVFKADDASDRVLERACDEKIARMQAGIMMHQTHFKAALKLTGYTFDNLKPYVEVLIERAIVYPTELEAHMITALVHTEDFGHDHVLQLGSARPTWRDLGRPRQAMTRLATASWPYASFASVWSRLPAFAYRAVELRWRHGL